MGGLTRPADIRTLVSQVRACESFAEIDPRDLATLGLLAHDDAAAQQAAVDAGVLVPLTGIILARGAPGHKRRIALATLLALIHGNTATRDAAAHAGMLWVLPTALATDSSSVTQLALLVLDTLVAGDDGASQRTAINAGALDALQRLARDGFVDERRLAKRVLRRNAVFKATIIPDRVATDDHDDLDTDDDVVLLLQGVAVAALSQFLAPHPSEAKGDAVKVLERLLDGLGDHATTDRWQALLRIEDLLALVSDTNALPPATADLLHARVVPLCVQYLQSHVDSHQAAAARILALVLHRDSALVEPVTDALGGVAAMVDRIANGAHAVVLVLYWLLDGERPDEDAHAEAAAAGAVSALVRVLEVGRPHERLAAAGAMGFLLPRHHTEALHAGAMAQLVRMLGAVGDDFLCEILAVVTKFVEEPDSTAKDVFVADGGPALVVRILADSTSGQVKCHAAALAVAAAKDHTLAHTAFSSAGVVAPLVRLLESDATTEIQAAAVALTVFADHHADNQAAVAASSAVGRLVRLLRNDATEKQVIAAYAVHRLTKDNDAPTQTAFAQAGAIAALVGLIGRGDGDVAYVVAEALASLVHAHSVNQTIAIDADAVTALLGMLRHGRDRYKRTAVAALASLVDYDGPDGSAGLVQLLVAMVSPPRVASLPPSSVREATRTLEECVADNARLQGVAVQAGAVEALVALVAATSRGSGDSILYSAITALSSVVTNHTAAQSLALDVGAVAVLVAVLRSATTVATETVAVLATLQCLVGESSRAQTALLATDALFLTRRFLHDSATTPATARLLVALVGERDPAAVTACWNAGLPKALATALYLADDAGKLSLLFVLASLATTDEAKRRVAAMVPLHALLSMGESPHEALQAVAVGFTMLVTGFDSAEQALSHAIATLFR